MATMISHTPIVFSELSSLDQEKLLACYRLFLGYMLEVMGDTSITLLDESNGTINSDDFSGLSK
jgi:hypothetical protein